MTKNNNIIYIASAEILAIPVKECGEALVDVKDSNVIQYGPPPECPLTANYYTKMRKTIFEKLCQAQNDLPHGWRIRLYEGFRSLIVQQMLFEEEYERVKKRQPHLNHEEHFRETTRLVSPVTNLDGSRNIPPHNTGAAVDIELMTAEGQLVDMGMVLKDWTMVSPDVCTSQCTTLTSIARDNRQILFDVMQKHGFVNYPAEWWHFSYGDRYWAYFNKQPHAIYDLLEDKNERIYA